MNLSGKIPREWMRNLIALSTEGDPKAVTKFLAEKKERDYEMKEEKKMIKRQKMKLKRRLRKKREDDEGEIEGREQEIEKAEKKDPNGEGDEKSKGSDEVRVQKVKKRRKKKKKGDAKAENLRGEGEIEKAEETGQNGGGDEMIKGFDSGAVEVPDEKVKMSRRLRKRKRKENKDNAEAEIGGKEEEIENSGKEVRNGEGDEMIEGSDTQAVDVADEQVTRKWKKEKIEDAKSGIIVGEEDIEKSGKEQNGGGDKMMMIEGSDAQVVEVPDEKVKKRRRLRKRKRKENKDNAEAEIGGKEEEIEKSGKDVRNGEGDEMIEGSDTQAVDVADEKVMRRLKTEKKEDAESDIIVGEEEIEKSGKEQNGGGDEMIEGSGTQVVEVPDEKVKKRRRLRKRKRNENKDNAEAEIGGKEEEIEKSGKEVRNGEGNKMIEGSDTQAVDVADEKVKRWKKEKKEDAESDIIVGEEEIEKSGKERNGGADEMIEGSDTQDVEVPDEKVKKRRRLRKRKRKENKDNAEAEIGGKEEEIENSGKEERNGEGDKMIEGSDTQAIR